VGEYPNELLVWEMMKWAKMNGYNIVENSWGNTQRLCRFKSKFNPTVSIYFACEKKLGVAKLLYSLKNLARSFK
jgi:lipid II:glycine glycyltransferase (peptidoglycan interpeptide bridge formation enzyme)